MRMAWPSSSSGPRRLPPAQTFSNAYGLLGLRSRTPSARRAWSRRSGGGSPPPPLRRGPLGLTSAVAAVGDQPHVRARPRRERAGAPTHSPSPEIGRAFGGPPSAPAILLSRSAWTAPFLSRRRLDTLAIDFVDADHLGYPRTAGRLGTAEEMSRSAPAGAGGRSPRMPIPPPPRAVGSGPVARITMLPARLDKLLRPSYLSRRTRHSQSMRPLTPLCPSADRCLGSTQGPLSDCERSRGASYDLPHGLRTVRRGERPAPPVDLGTVVP